MFGMSTQGVIFHLSEEMTRGAVPVAEPRVSDGVPRSLVRGASTLGMRSYLPPEPQFTRAVDEGQQFIRYRGSVSRTGSSLRSICH